MGTAETALRDYCKVMLTLYRELGDRWRVSGSLYDGMEDFLLVHGEFYPPVPTLPRGVRPGRKKMCFANAMRLALRQPHRYRYVEGLATSIIPVHHAWCLDVHDNVVDPTWQGEGFLTHPPLAYLGVVLPLSFATKGLQRSGCALLNWQDDFPAFKIPREKGQACHLE